MNSDTKPTGFVKDVFFRAHVVELKPKPRAANDYHEPKLAEWVLCFDSETTLDPQTQALVFLFYRVLHLENGAYVTVEEGIAHADNLSIAELKITRDYVRSCRAEVVSDEYDEHLHIYSRTEFMEKVFFEAVRNRAFICFFNASFDLSRLMLDYKSSRNRTWRLVLSQRELDVEKLRKNWLTKKWGTTKRGNLRTKAGDYLVTIKCNDNQYQAAVYTPEKERLSGEWQPSVDAAKQDALRILSEHVGMMKRSGRPAMEANPERPCIIVTAKDSKAAFFKLSKPIHPEEWPTYKETRSGKETLKMIFRVLDLRTLAWALYNESHSLKSLCKFLQTKNQKQDHDPSGKVTLKDLDYCRQDVRCTVDALNALIAEFMQHPIDLHPDRTVSPASIGKAYMLQMGYVPPSEKFKDIPNFDYMCGIAAQAFSAGRAEVRIRNTAVGVCHTDITSQYPSCNSLLGNPAILAAETLSFDDCTDEISALIANITRKDCFVKENWRKWNVFCLVQADHDLLPVRAEYAEHSGAKNIGLNFLTAKEPVWLHLCDVINSKILNGGKVPRILKAIRVVPHGTQPGLRPVKLRDEIEIDPRADDIFKVMIEQKEVYKRAAKEKRKLAKQKRLDGDIAGADALEAQAEIDLANSYFSKICANGTSYGMYFELTPQKLFNSVEVEVFSGEHRESLTVSTVERPGKFYFPIIAASITAAAHLMLGLIQTCVEEKGSHFSHCDTDALVPVATETGGWIHCPDERGPNGRVRHQGAIVEGSG